MPEPSSSAASGAIIAKVLAGKTTGALLAKLAAALCAGAAGGYIMAWLDPTVSRKARIAQGAAAGVGGIIFGPITVRVLDERLGLGIDGMPLWESLELYVLPICFLVGALSWGGFSALAKFRRILADKAADLAAKKAGLE